MKKYIYIGVFSLLLINCSSSKCRINEFVYEMETERVNIGETYYAKTQPPRIYPPGSGLNQKVHFEEQPPLIKNIKTLSLNGEFQVGCNLKTQKLGREKKTDSVFSKGQLYIQDDLMICIQKHYFGYMDNKTIIKIFEQQKDGSFEFKKSVHFKSDENAE